MEKDYDVMVIGSGVAAMAAAQACAKAGRRVAVVDEQAFGGTCPLRGCDPKKVLRRGAEVIEAARLMRGRGIVESDLHVDWRALVAFKRSFTEPVPEEMRKSLEAAGIAAIHGHARFVDKDVLAVDGNRFRAGHIVVATGARPRRLDIPGAEHMIDSTAFMELESLPRRILFVGGGYVSFEFAHMAARAGSEVIIVNRHARVLKGFDPDLVEKLVACGEEAGVKVLAPASPKAIVRRGDSFRVTLDRQGQDEDIDAGLVVLGAGRQPDIDGLDVAAGGIEIGKRGGIAVDDHLRSSSNPRVYAAGDAAETQGPPLTPVARLEGEAAASNILDRDSAVPDYRGVPSVVFTLPALARVGLLEEEARRSGRDVEVMFTDTSGWYSTRRIGAACAAVKIIRDTQTDTVLGAHLLGPGHGEFANLFALAVRLQIKTADLKRIVPAYPSLASDLPSLL